MSEVSTPPLDSATTNANSGSPDLVQADAVALAQADAPLAGDLPARRAWHPSKRQRAYLHAWLDPTGPKTKEGIAQTLGIPRSTLYHWLTLPHFMTWFNAEMDRHCRQWWFPALDKVGRLAQQGSAEHFKLLAQVYGKLQSESPSVGVQVIVGIPRPGDSVPVPPEPERPGLLMPSSESDH